MSDVPRETSPAPPPPEGAGALFPDGRLSLAVRLADLLAGPGVVRGLIGPRETPRLWTRHLLNCAALEEALPVGARVCDVGSGAGLPGLVLAVARPDLTLTLVEPLLRRTTFLEEAVGLLGLGEAVTVVRGRAEALHGAARFDVVTSRAVAPLDRLLEWSMPLVEPTGALVAMKGASVRDEVTDAAPTLARLGCGAPEVVELGRGRLAETSFAVRVPWADPARVSWPAPGGSSTDRRRSASAAGRRSGGKGRRRSR